MIKEKNANATGAKIYKSTRRWNFFFPMTLELLTWFGTNFNFSHQFPVLLQILYVG